MRKLFFALALAVSVVALAKIIPVGSVTSTSGAQAVLALPASVGPADYAIRCNAPATAQTGTVTYYKDGGFVLYTYPATYSDGGAYTATDGGVVGVYAGSNDPLVVTLVPEIARPMQTFPGENAIAVAGLDGGTAQCVVSTVNVTRY